MRRLAVTLCIVAAAAAARAKPPAPRPISHLLDYDADGASKALDVITMGGTKSQIEKRLGALGMLEESRWELSPGHFFVLPRFDDCERLIQMDVEIYYDDQKELDTALSGLKRRLGKPAGGPWVHQVTGSRVDLWDSNDEWVIRLVLEATHPAACAAQ
jgi:hypothetical protein